MLSHANLIRTADYVSIDVTGIKDAESIVGIIERLDSESRKKDSVPPFFIKVSLGQSFPPSSAVTAAITASESVVGVNVAGYGLASGNNKQITKFSTSEDVTVSGVMIREKATQAVGEWYKALGRGSRGKEIIASGGVLTGKDALEKIEAGASFVNVFSAFVLDGPPVARRIKTQLSVQLMNKGYYNLDEAIGANHREKSRRLKHAEKRRKRF
jgi:dihydroorotate dehydrogenase